jgi:ParB family chromosome partitioning protein
MQPRRTVSDEDVAELVDSIREHGVLQPVLVRPASGAYELVAGERRWRAARAAGLRTVPAVVRTLDDRSALEAAIVENVQREDLNPMERARAYHRLSSEFGLTQEGIAKRIGKSQAAVANSLRLLGLPADIQASVEAGRISEGHARALLSIQDQSRVRRLWKEIETRGMSVREAETAARRAKISREIPRRRSDAGEMRKIEQMLKESLGTPVRLAIGKDGRGEIRITFFSPEDLDRLVEAISIRRVPGR